MMHSLVLVFLLYCFLTWHFNLFTRAERRDVHSLECKIVTHKNDFFYIMNGMKMPIVCGGTLEALHFDERDIFANLTVDEGEAIATDEVLCWNSRRFPVLSKLIRNCDKETTVLSSFSAVISSVNSTHQVVDNATAQVLEFPDVVGSWNENNVYSTRLLGNVYVDYFNTTPVTNDSSSISNYNKTDEPIGVLFIGDSINRNAFNSFCHHHHLPKENYLHCPGKLNQAHLVIPTVGHHEFCKNDQVELGLFFIMGSELMTNRQIKGNAGFQRERHACGNMPSGSFERMNCCYILLF